MEIPLAKGSMIPVTLEWLSVTATQGLLQFQKIKFWYRVVTDGVCEQSILQVRTKAVALLSGQSLPSFHAFREDGASCSHLTK